MVTLVLRIYDELSCYLFNDVCPLMSPIEVTCLIFSYTARHCDMICFKARVARLLFFKVRGAHKSTAVKILIALCTSIRLNNLFNMFLGN